MNCHRFETELRKWGNLNALETDTSFGKHLKVCSICPAKRDIYTLLYKMLSADQPPIQDDAFWASFPALVRERIEKTKARPRWKPVLGWSLPVAILLIMAGIAIFLPDKQTNVTNLTTEEAFNYAGTTGETADLPLPEKTLTSVAAQAEEELVGTLKVEELVYTLSEEQLKTLEEKLTNFKL